MEITSVNYLEEVRDRVVSPYKNSKKKTTETFKEELRLLGICVDVLGEYISAKTELECACKKCSYIWKTIPNRLLNGLGCPKCAGRTLPSIFELNEKLESQGKTFRISGVLSKSTDKLLASCSGCGSSWYGVYGSFIRKGYSCKICRKDSIENPNKEKQDALNKEFQERLQKEGRDFTLVGNYNKIHRNVTVSCNVCSRIWTNKAATILSSGCAKCSQKLKGSIEELREFLVGRDIEVFGEYVNTFTKVNCKCIKCGESWDTTPKSLKSSGCPFCCFKGRLPKIPTHLYYVKINHASGTYWKVGITTKTNVMDRFAGYSGKGKIELVYSFLFENGEEAYHAEKNILRIFKSYLIQDGTRVLRDGNTEIFTKDVLQMGHLLNNRSSLC